MDTLTVSLFGNRHIENAYEVEKRLEKLVSQLLCEHLFVEFLVGRDGDFDILAASVIRRVDKKMDKGNCMLVWVQPYLLGRYTNDMDTFNRYYTEIEVCESSATVHPKAAFRIRNEKMIDRSALVVVYTRQPSGGAYTALRYAEKSGKQLLRL